MVRGGQSKGPAPTGDGGGLWVVALLTCPLVGWLVGSSIVVVWTPGSWWWRTVAWLVIGAGLPLAAWARHALHLDAGRLGLLVVTLGACAFTWSAWRHLLDGPTTATVDVQAIECKVHQRRTGPTGPCILDELRLGDGRRLIADPDTTRGLRPPRRARLVSLDDVALSLQAE